MLCRRPPFDDSQSELPSIPEEYRDDIELGSWVLQVSAYLETAKEKFGLAVSERIRTHLLLLSGFDPDLGFRLLQFFEAKRKTDAEYAAGRFSDVFDDPLLRYYLALAILFLIIGGCPEERQKGMLGSAADCLLNARRRAEDVFEPELASAGEVSSAFQWSTEPGPFERQLQRQQNNPLFPTRARVISAQQVTDARLADLRLMSDFMTTYRPIVRKILSNCGKTVGEASDFQRRIMDLIPSCMSLGDYFSNELKSLTKFSDIMQEQVIATTKETGLQNTYDRYVALLQTQGYLRILGTALPSEEGTEDYSMRSILSEGLGTISNYADLCGRNGVLGDKPLDLAQRVIREAIQAGLDPDLGQLKLVAFRSGLGRVKPKPPSGIWASLKRFIRRS
jgi:hypothetical protein